MPEKFPTFEEKSENLNYTHSEASDTESEMERISNLEEFHEVSDYEVPETKENTSLDKLKVATQKIITWGMLTSATLGAFRGPDTASAARSEEEPRSSAELEHERNENYLESMYGEGILFFANNFEKHQIVGKVGDFIEKATYTDQETEKIKFEGFEQLGLSNEEVNTIFADTYPGNWVHEDVEKVKYEPETEYYGDESRYGAKLKATASTTVSAWGRSDISIYMGGSLYGISDVYGHESAHANDWESDSTMTEFERVSMLAEVTKFFNSENRKFTTGYIEMIDIDDEEYELYNKVKEWWAEAALYYFSTPGIMQEAHPREFELVDKWVKVQDPHYDVFVANNKRKETLDSVVYGIRLVNLDPEVKQKESLNIEVKLKDNKDNTKDVKTGDMSVTEEGTESDTPGQEDKVESDVNEEEVGSGREAESGESIEDNKRPNENTFEDAKSAEELTEEILAKALENVKENEPALKKAQEMDRKFGGTWHIEEFMKIMMNKGVPKEVAQEHMKEFFGYD